MSKSNSKFNEYSDLDLIYLFCNCMEEKEVKLIEKELKSRGVSTNYENLNRILFTAD